MVTRMQQPSRQGFTLIELLAGMTILVLMVLFLTKVFTDSSTAWTLGTKRVESSLSGRTAAEFMSRELASAIFNGNLTFKLESNMDNYLGVASDRLYFVSTDQRAQPGSSLYRQTRAVSYKLSPMKHPDWRDNSDLPFRYRVMRAGLEDYANPLLKAVYTNKLWWTAFKNNQNLYGETLVENVRALDFWVYDRNGNVRANYDSSVDGPPAYVDILVEIIPDADAVRLVTITDANDREAYADRVARRYFNRVYFHNLQGYALAP